MSRVLVLNHNFSPLQIISWTRAMRLVFKEKAEIIRHSNQKVNTPSDVYFLPVIIRIIKIIRKIYKRYIPLSKPNVIVRDNYTCQYCGARSNKLTIDHIVPLSRGGKDLWENLVASCYKCNNSKNNLTPKEANMSLLKQPKKPTITEFLNQKLKVQGFYEIFQEFLDNEFN